ncbi:MAG: hypothetical protein IKW03_01405 [Clostridia bacterium]|nr:hypothetical protein [Clostridia bacterium]
MTDLFISLFNMSITASWLVLAVIALRFLLKKAPKWINAVLWAFVGFRLICPFSFESIFSLIPSTDTVPHDIIYSQSPTIHSGIPSLNSTVNPIISETFAPDVTNSVNPLQVVLFVTVIVWLIGIFAMLVYSAVSFIRLSRKVREGVVLKDNIWLCDRIDTPFILGLFRPRIFLPSGMAESDMEYVIAHEKAHLRRRDHWWKPLGFMLCTVYWFNPVMWLAYILLCRDIELACDEKVIKEMGTEARKPYSEALINCSVSRRTISACPLAFGETGVKDRIKSVLSYKKPTLWIIIVAVISCIVVAVCFLTNPKSELKDSNPELDKAVSQTILEINSSGELYNTECVAEGHIIYGVEEEGDNVTVYLLEEFAGFGFKNGYFMEQTGHRTPAVYTFINNDDDYVLSDYDYPMDGEKFYDSIKEMFPKEYHSRILDYNEKDNAGLWPQCVAYAEAYLKNIGRDAEVCHYSEVPHVLLTDVGVSVEVSNKITENESFYKYDYDIGYYETLENGIRYIYRTDYDKDRGVIIYTTEVYKTGDIIEKIEVDGQTGKILLKENNDVILPEPETDYYDNKYDYLEKLDYTTAAKIVTEMPDKYSITAVHYPASGKVESGILVGEAYGYDLGIYLRDADWNRSLPPIEELSSPGSVEFVVDEEYRVSVYERKKGSLFAYAVVRYGDEERYYHVSYDDYKNAVALLHPPVTVDEPVEGFHSYSFITENDSAYISLNPTAKTVFFSLSRLSDFVVNGTYQDYTDKLLIISDNEENKYMFRKSGENLIFVADESTPVPEYKYKTDGEAESCIPDEAVFTHSGFERYYIDKVLWDIDGDIYEENCVLTYGPTSGLFTFVFNAYDKGELKYSNTFNCDINNIQFMWDENGTLQITGEKFVYGEVPTQRSYDVIVEDGNIVLKSGNEMMPYWGEQGISSPYAGS